LIIVMAVMNGFRAELLDRILGVNGHLIVQPLERPLDDFAPVAERIAALEGVRSAVPLVEGQVLASGSVGAGTGALVRGIREQDVGRQRLVAENIRQGTLEGLDASEGVVIGSRMAN